MALKKEDWQKVKEQAEKVLVDIELQQIHTTLMLAKAEEKLKELENEP